MTRSVFTDEYDYFLKLLNDCRSDANITQTELAARLGVGQSVISKCERGVRRLDFIESVHWALALGIKPAELTEMVASYISSSRKPGDIT